jgi:beta-glucanase (GH16 family)
MRVDNGQGYSLVASLWPTSDTWPPEIDFTEDSGGSPRTTDAATEHWGVGTNYYQLTNDLTVNLTQWHTVGVEWTPGKIVYTMDGVPWATEANANVSNVPMQLALQIQAWQCGASSWEQCANSSTPAEVDMDVDWIAVYSPAS